ncbi:MAG TPA: NAD(P)-dependent oxidoreductase [Bacteroidales bacterium]|nr:NAD(P)-dependent oxidoreductase [Bacteroidales bacterium]
MTSRKVLFIDTAHPVLTEELTQMGYQCDYFDKYSHDDYLRIVDQYFGIIIRGKIKLDVEMLKAARQLKFIGRVGAGMENIDVAYAESIGIACLNAPEGNRDAVGEHAVGMLLMLMNRLRIADREVRQGIWLREENRGIEIKDKTVAIIGYGNMGGAFARVLKGFGANVIAYDKYKSDYSDDFVRESDMQTIFDDADIVSLHLPLTSETTFLVDEDYLKKFRKNIYLINTARGRNVKTADLVKQMKAGKVLGAALDVLEYEKLSFEALDQQSLPEDFTWLIRSDRVVLSPHIAGWTHESNYKLAKTIVDKVSRLFGEKAE